MRAIDFDISPVKGSGLLLLRSTFGPMVCPIKAGLSIDAMKQVYYKF